LAQSVECTDHSLARAGFEQDFCIPRLCHANEKVTLVLKIAIDCALDNARSFRDIGDYSVFISTFVDHLACSGKDVRHPLLARQSRTDTGSLEALVLIIHLFSLPSFREMCTTFANIDLILRWFEEHSELDTWHAVMDSLVERTMIRTQRIGKWGSGGSALLPDMQKIGKLL
jgi:hypothetical protein